MVGKNIRTFYVRKWGKTFFTWKTHLKIWFYSCRQDGFHYDAPVPIKLKKLKLTRLFQFSRDVGLQVSLMMH